MRSDTSSSFKATGGVEMVGPRGVDSAVNLMHFCSFDIDLRDS
jgi:hypothetical protein